MRLFSEQRKALAHISSYGSHCERAIQKVLKLILNILQGYKQLKGKKGKNLERNPATTCKMVVLTHLWLLLKYMHLPEKLLILTTNVRKKQPCITHTKNLCILALPKHWEQGQPRQWRQVTKETTGKQEIKMIEQVSISVAFATNMVLLCLLKNQLSGLKNTPYYILCLTLTVSGSDTCNMNAEVSNTSESP